MKKLIAIIGAFGLTSTATGTLVSCGYYANLDGIGSVQKISINRDLTNNFLGDFDKTLTETDQILVLKIIAENNPELNMEEVRLDWGRSVSKRIILEVKDNSLVYWKESVSLIYNIKNSLLNAIPLEDRHLGVFNPNPSEQTLKTAIGRKYKDLNLNEVNFKFDYEDLKIIVDVNENSKIYLPGEAILTYAVRKFLGDVIPNKDLGMLDPNISSDQLLEKIAEAHPEIDLKELDFEFDLVNRTIVIKVKQGSDVYVNPDTITLTYKVKKDIQEVFKNVTNWIFPRTPKAYVEADKNYHEALNEALKRNVGLDLTADEVDITVDKKTKTIKFTINENSRFYINGTSVEVVYQRNLLLWDNSHMPERYSENFGDYVEVDFDSNEWKEIYPKIRAEYNSKRESDEWERFLRLFQISQQADEDFDEYLLRMEKELTNLTTAKFIDNANLYLRFLTLAPKAEKTKQAFDRFFISFIQNIDFMDFVKPSFGTTPEEIAEITDLLLWGNNLKEYYSNWFNSPTKP